MLRIIINYDSYVKFLFKWVLLSAWATSDFDSFGFLGTHCSI